MQVNQPHVQLAVARTLVNDPHFQKLLRDENKVIAPITSCPCSKIRLIVLSQFRPSPGPQNYVP